jgi:CheY-like chemotaxis protein
MPKMTGDKLVKEILNIQPDIPVILCTGFSEKIDEEKAREIGAADYIEKPLDKRDFAFKVRKFWTRSKKRVVKDDFSSYFEPLLLSFGQAG